LTLPGAPSEEDQSPADDLLRTCHGVAGRPSPTVWLSTDWAPSAGGDRRDGAGCPVRGDLRDFELLVGDRGLCQGRPRDADDMVVGDFQQAVTVWMSHCGS
jgi:hypothetical protein